MYSYWAVGSRYGALGKLNMHATWAGALVGLDTASWKSPPGSDERRVVARHEGGELLERHGQGELFVDEPRLREQRGVEPLPVSSRGHAGRRSSVASAGVTVPAAVVSETWNAAWER